MGKKLFSDEKWKRHLKRRQHYEERKAQEKNKKSSISSVGAGIVPPQQRRKRISLVAPETFSIVMNPEEALEFISTLKYYARRVNLLLDLRNVSLITTDAIALLIATMESVSEYASVVGHEPTDHNAREILIQSGFFDHVKSVHPIPSRVHGKIAQKRSKHVEPGTARDLIRVGTEAVYGAPERRRAAYRTLIECMNNTHNHASKPEKARETWWSTVYGDANRRRVCYTFLDTGVGIFRSVKIGALRRAYRIIGVRTNAAILRDILEGKVESSSGFKYRGKGLPSINALCVQGKIRSLVIVANDVFANVSSGDYRLLKTHLPGTLLYWETE